MEIYAETAMSILDELHTERLAYHSEYLPLAYAINRLESYEDTGLSPEEIERILDSYGRGMTLRTENAQRLEIIKEIPINRLRELAQAEKEGRLVVLPCKVGDTVYIIHNRAIRKTTVESIHQWSSGHWKLSVHTDKKYIHWTGYEVHFESFGKTVFLTREAAEAALEGTVK